MPLPRLQLLLLLAAVVRSDIVVENDLIIPEEIYDFLYSTDSSVWWQSPNTTKYYCIFRNLWTKMHHPKEYPPNARWGPVVMYSAVKEVRVPSRGQRRRKDISLTNCSLIYSFGLG